MALKGIKVVELSGLAPVPFCGMILTDFGASVIRVDKLGSASNLDVLGNGKKSLALNLKKSQAVNIVRHLCKNSDVLVEPFRRGVMEKLGLGPDVLLKENPRLIYARLTGYGQNGYYADRAGHDINYLALSGLLSLFGRKGDKPLPPANLGADFGGGGLMCAFGIVLALLERTKSGLGQVIDSNMVEGSAYLGSWLYRSQKLPIWGKKLGENVLDSGAHFYDTYQTKDGKFMAVGALEPQFYEQLLDGLGLDSSEIEQFGEFEKNRKILSEKFLEKTQDEWCEIFDEKDGCVTPILSVNEAPNHVHNFLKQSFLKDESVYIPKPAPSLSRTPGNSKGLDNSPECGQHTVEILKSLGYSTDEILKLNEEHVIDIGSSKL